MENLIHLTNTDRKKGLTLPRNVTEDLAYLAGTFAGDGSIGYRSNKNEYSLKMVGNPKDERKFYDNIVSKKLKDVFGITPEMRLFDSSTTYGFQIFSKNMVLYLTKVVGLPFAPKYGKLSIPIIFQGNTFLLRAFIRGLFDTDGCICFKRRYRDYPYYPVISLTSKSERFTKQIASVLKKLGFHIVETYNYKTRDIRSSKRFTKINRIELNGQRNFSMWMEKISFSSPKHLEKIKKRGSDFSLPSH